MPRFVVSMAVVLVGCPLLADDWTGNSLPAAARKELARLQGEWVAREFRVSDKRVEVKGERLILAIRGDRWIFDGMDKGEIIALDPTCDPKRLDVKSAEE